MGRPYINYRLGAYLLTLFLLLQGPDSTATGTKIWNGFDYIDTSTAQITGPVNFSEIQVARGIHVAFVPGTPMNRRILLGALVFDESRGEKPFSTFDPNLACLVLGYSYAVQFQLGDTEPDDGRHNTDVVILTNTEDEYSNIRDELRFGSRILNRSYRLKELVMGNTAARLYFLNLSPRTGFAQHIKSLTCER